MELLNKFYMVNYDTQDLQYLQMMQENIARMAGNSANAKTWLVTIITGFLRLVAVLRI